MCSAKLILPVLPKTHLCSSDQLSRQPDGGGDDDGDDDDAGYDGDGGGEGDDQFSSDELSRQP